MTPRPVLILKVGETVPRLRSRGCFDDWFRAGLGLEPADTRVVRPHQGEALPDRRDVSAVVITGSSAMLTESPSWSLELEAWLHDAVRGELPVLGVCYGHQLLARAFGGEVGWNPHGREIGTIEVALTDDARTDPLFGAFPATLTVQATHSQSVLALPPDARHLGRNEHDGYQAFALGRNAWGVQFHPEFDATIIRGYLEERRADIAAEGIDVDARLAAARDSEHGRRILGAFAERLRA